MLRPVCSESLGRLAEIYIGVELNPYRGWLRSAKDLTDVGSHRSTGKASHSLTHNLDIRVLGLEMLPLPPELLQLILSILDHYDLWVLVQVSRFFQQLALPSLLSRHKITPLQIHSGSHLTIQSEGLSLHGLAHIIRDIPPIPDVLLRVRVERFEDPELTEIVATLSRRGRDPIVVAHGSLDISHPRSAPRLQDWTYHRVLGPSWNQAQRIAADFAWLSADSIRIQTILVPGASQFTLLTVPATAHHLLYFPKLLGFSSAGSKALLGALDVTYAPESLVVESDCGLDLHALLALAERHPSIRWLTLQSGLLDSASLHSSVAANSHSTRITCLRAPAKYIPHVWPFLPGITYLDIDVVGNPSQLAEALGVIAASSARLSGLFLSFGWLRPPRQSLPWRSAASPPLMHGIAQLTIYANFVYSARDAEGLPRWLALFPDLERVELRCGTFIPVSSRAGLAESIAATRTTSPGAWEGVHFI
ncbi:hypothetical protein B0H16DRAFT_1458050 [Mycena metata]|uniref:F-box domain-containing protein n=1 Tax=Mycena metata TaxID=1033252 RepID=A0AAD7J485_9AGAR|nr:hypothetical protein B0H16DRAFT_1458050 [Mycena metata]